MNLHKAIRYIILCLLLMSCISMPGRAQYFHFTQGKKSESLHFRFIKNLIIVPFMINGKGPYNFVLDTGIGIMLITDPSLSDSLKLNNLRPLKISGFGEGDDLTAWVTPSLYFSTGKYIIGETSAAILQEDAFNLSGYTGIPIHGLIGYEFFSSFTVRINYFTNLIRIYSLRRQYVPRRSYRIPLTIEDRKPYLYAVATTEAGRHDSVRLIIDTGAGHPVSLETHDGEPYQVPVPNIRANLGIGLSGNINGHIARIPSLQIGRYRLENVITAFPDYEDVAGKFSTIKRNGNIGNNILRRFHVVFDYTAGCMYLKANARYRDAFEHDMSGMEITLAAPDYKRLYISRVEEGSAAEDAGLKESDEIISINLKPVSEMGLEEIHELLRSGNKRGLLLKILSHGEKQPELVVLTLKRRI